MAHRLAKFDYSKPFFYMVTLRKCAEAPMFSEICGSPECGYLVQNDLTRSFTKTILSFHETWHCIEPITCFSIMPDHIHLLVKIRSCEKRLTLPRIVWLLVRELEAAAGASRRQTPTRSSPNPDSRSLAQPRSAGLPSSGHFFEKVWHDWIVMKDGQLAAFTRYIRENPKRAWLRRQNSRYFGTVRKIAFAGREWFAYGNDELLKLPVVEPFQCSRKWAADGSEWREALGRASRIGPGCAGVGTFMSPCEKECGNAIFKAGGSLVVLSPEGFGERWHPTRNKEALCARGRMLFLSLYEPSPSKPDSATLHRRCHEMGDAVVAALAPTREAAGRASRRQTPTRPYPNPASRSVAQPRSAGLLSSVGPDRSSAPPRSAGRLFGVAALALFAAVAFAEDLPNDKDVRLDLGGGTKVIENWEWPGWNGYALSVTNGTLSVTGRMFPRHGVTDIMAGGTLRFEKGSCYLPGMNDAQARTTRIFNGGTLDLSHGELRPFNTRFEMHPGSTVILGCDLKSVPHGHRWRAKGGRLVITENVDFDMNEFFVETNAVLEADVADGKVVDASRVTVSPGVEIKETGKGFFILSHDDPRWPNCQTRRAIDRMDIHACGDTANRCYALYYNKASTAVVARVTYDCPEFGKITTSLPYRHVRYPEGCKGPFKIKATIEVRDGTVFERTVEVPFEENPIGKPAPNDQIFLGMVAYGEGRERHEMITNDLANLYVRWNNIPQLMPENANNEISPNWMEEAEKRGIRAMLIYSHPSKEQVGLIRAAWGDRYLGNNCGERTGFLYGAPGEMKGPQDCATLTDAREWFLTGFFRGNRPPRGRGPKDDPFAFATSGAAFANYELPAGIDYVCNELYACGCQSLTYATAENRGAARKWGPEWWSGWLAHEWQTFPIPYQSDDKYLSLEAGIKSLYLMGTSLMCLESGSSGTQAHQYTWGVPEEHRKTGFRYDEDPPRRYRETIRKCHLFIKEHPRARGTPETKIALALGRNDSYIGMPVTPWAQHKNRKSHTNEAVNVWSASAPENSWNCAREIFMPDSGTRGVNGMPHGQVDVVGIDEQTRLSDLSRYSLIAFGGWNTMTPHAKDVLEQWVAGGGTCVMCLPQCSTRDDRDYVHYGVEDLLIPFGLKAESFEKSNGIEVARLAPSDLVKVEKTTGDNGAPLVATVEVGKGRLHLLLGKQFPAANNNLASAWKQLLSDCGGKVEQAIRLTQANNDDKPRFFMAAAYDEKAYVMNLDMHKTRKVNMILDGSAPQELELAPLEVREFPRR